MSYHANWYQQWGIYGTTRGGDKFLPDTYALWATDGGRYFQGGAGTVVVLYRDGYLYLTRGDVLLGAVPFDGPPSACTAARTSSLAYAARDLLLLPRVDEADEMDGDHRDRARDAAEARAAQARAADAQAITAARKRVAELLAVVEPGADSATQRTMVEAAGGGRLPVTPTEWQGTVAALESLAELRDTVDTDVVRRVDGRRTVTLSIVPPRDVALETAVQRVEDELLPALQQEGYVPPGMSLEVSGAADQLEATRRSLGVNFAVATILIYLVLVAIFTHWGWPLMILTTVPLGLAGGVLGLALANAIGVRLPFDMITMLGFLILLGTVVNNPILVVDRTRELLRTTDLAVVDAVRQAVASRLRPILMTTLTTVVGLAPLVLIPGAGTELYRGLGVVVLSGLVCSTIVTLTFLPAALIELWSLRPAAMSAIRKPG
jgi:preprotein translocase subunit SecF